MKRHLSLVTLVLIIVSAACTFPFWSELTDDTPGSSDQPVQDMDQLAAALESEEAEVERAGTISQPFLSVEGQIIRVNGEDVQVFEYPDEATLQLDAAQIPPDGTSFPTIMITWIATPHFYKTDRLLVLYVGDNPDTIRLLESFLGSQFAGG